MARRATHKSSPENARLILEAALDLAVQVGYDGTTMAEVARRAGLPVGSVYWHFENKEKLFSDLIDHCFEIWKDEHSGPTNRALLRRSIVGSAGGSVSPANRAESFWALTLTLALERRLEGNLARQRYLEVRKEMFEHMVARIQPQMPPEVLEDDPDFARKMVVLGRALTNGFYISAGAGDEIDFEEFADLSATAIETMVQRQVALVAERRKAAAVPVAAGEGTQE